MKKSKPPKSKPFEPEWLDEDPDAKDNNDLHDLYGDMTNVQKFHSKSIETPQKPTKATRESVAQLCGRLGMRYIDNAAHLDLHGMRLANATSTVHSCLNALIEDGRIKRVRIITGKGNHSQGTGILAQEIHPYVHATFAKDLEDIDPSPAELLVRGHPARGYFNLKLS